MLGKQPLHPLAQLRVRLASLVEERRPLGRIALSRASIKMSRSRMTDTSRDKQREPPKISATNRTGSRKEISQFCFPAR